MGGKLQQFVFCVTICCFPPSQISPRYVWMGWLLAAEAEAGLSGEAGEEFIDHSASIRNKDNPVETSQYCPPMENEEVILAQRCQKELDDEIKRRKERQVK